ncbi:hypothetical protein BH23ACT8_BH23ACT8_13800 [soil metagenome]
MSALLSTAPRPTRPVSTTPRSRPELRVVGRAGRTGWWVTLLLIVGATGIFGIVTLSALGAENAFAARELETEIDELSYRYDELTAEVAGLETPERIRQVAGSELGMVPAEQPGYLVLRDPGNDAADQDQRQERDIVADGDGAVSDPVKHARDTARGPESES